MIGWLGSFVKRGEFVRTLEKNIEKIDNRLAGHDKNISDLENHNRLLIQKIDTVEKENMRLRNQVDKLDERLHSLRIQAETPGRVIIDVEREKLNSLEDKTK